MRVHVIAKANAFANKVTEISDGSYKIFVTAFPEHGKANAAIARLLAKHLKIPLTRISLTRGASSKDKYFEVED